MVTPEWLTDELGYLVTHKQLQESILRSIVRRLQKTNFIMTDTAAWQAEKLQQAGMLHDEILKEVAKLTKKSDEEIRKIFADAKVEVFNYDDEILKKAGYVPKEFKNLSPAMIKTLNATFKKTVKEVRNLTWTTAVTSQRCFISACDLAHMQIVSGAFTYQEAIKNAIKAAAKEGTKIVYPSGKTSSLDAAVRRAALTGVNQTTGKLMEMRADDMDIDIMEISAHFGARPSHAEWQGQLVSRSGKKGYLTLADVGYGTVGGFMGANCRHNWFIFFEGISKRNYTKEQLDKLKNETVTYNGEEILVWKARDKQRAYERNIRSIKEQLVAFDEAAKNVLTPEEQMLWKAEINNLSVKLKSGEAALKDFCNQTGLARDRFREQVFAAQTENGIKNFGKSVSQKAVQGYKKEIDKYTKYHYNKDGTIVVTDYWIGTDVHKLPKEYKPFAVIQTLENKGSHYQYNRTCYDDNGMIQKMLHCGNHNNAKKHPYGKNGEHFHFYTWKDDGSLEKKITKEFTDIERKECKDIL